MKSGSLAVAACAAMLALVSCGRASAGGDGGPTAAPSPTPGPALPSSAAPAEDPAVSRIRAACAAAQLPAELAEALAAAALSEGPALEAELAAAAVLDPYLRAPVDKMYALPETYEPADLRDLAGPSYRVNRAGLRLRAAAAEALETMAAAARAEGLTLVASSAYRSFAYQRQVYTRIVGELGQEEADRESARPGHSEHQLGLALDFGSIDDSFAETPAGRWLKDNAGRFGWVLSYPMGMEQVTGYRWESWHYRYVGPVLYDLIERRFGGVKHHAFRFLYQYLNN